MSVKKLLVLGFAAVLLGSTLTAVFLRGFGAGRSSPPSVGEPISGVAQNEGDDAVVPREPLTVRSLLAEYAADAVAAELKYPKGKRITVSGIVQKAERQPEGNTVVDMGVRMEQSTMPPGNISCITLDSNLVPPANGTIVTVVGTKRSAQMWEHPVYGTHTYIVLGPCELKDGI